MCCSVVGYGAIHGAARLIASTRARIARSEEHTSELQSQSNLVCRLLLEKKKNPLPTCSSRRYCSDTHRQYIAPSEFTQSSAAVRPVCSKKKTGHRSSTHPKCSASQSLGR